MTKLNNVREVNCLKPVAIEKTSPCIFTFHYKRAEKEWSLAWSKDAAFEFAHLTRYEPRPIADHDAAAISELRKYGFLKLTPQGAIAEPVTVSDLGWQVSAVLAEIQFEPLGTRCELTC